MPDIVGLLDNILKERYQLHQLVVRLVHEPGHDWDTVLQLVTKCLQ